MNIWEVVILKAMKTQTEGRVLHRDFVSNQAISYIYLMVIDLKNWIFNTMLKFHQMKCDKYLLGEEYPGTYQC